MAEDPKPVYWPQDIREDVALFGPVTVPQLLKMLPLWATAFLLFAFLRVSLFARFLLLALIAGGGSLALLANLPQWAEILRRYRDRPRVLIGDGPPSAPRSLAALSQVAALHGPFLQYLDGTWAAVLEVTVPPWEHLPAPEQRLLQSAFELCLRRAAQAQVSLTIFAEVLPDLVRDELARQEARLEGCDPDGGLHRLAAARLRHHRRVALTLARRVNYYLRVAAAPGQVQLHRRPGDAADRRDLLQEFLRQTLAGLSLELQRAGLQPVVLSPDALRDLCARQLDPASWRELPPPAAPDWAWEAGAERPPLQGEPAAPPDEPETTPPVLPPSLAPTPPQPPDAVRPDPRHLPRTASDSGEGATRRTWWGRLFSRWQQRARRRSPQPSRRALILMLSGKGGTGLTTLAANLAVLLAVRGYRAAALALDGRGDLVSYLGLSVAVTAGAWRSLSDTLWVPGPAGLTVVPGPSDPEEPLPAAALQGVLQALHERADLTVADLGCDWSPLVQELLHQATHALVVTTADRLAWEHAALVAQRLHVIGVDLSQVGLVVNLAGPEPLQGLPPLPFGWYTEIPADGDADRGIPALDAPQSALIGALERVLQNLRL